jgi:hypothetical protein
MLWPAVVEHLGREMLWAAAAEHLGDHSVGCSSGTVRWRCCGLQRWNIQGKAVHWHRVDRTHGWAPAAAALSCVWLGQAVRWCRRGNASCKEGCRRFWVFVWQSHGWTTFYSVMHAGVQTAWQSFVFLHGDPGVRGRERPTQQAHS